MENCTQTAQQLPANATQASSARTPTVRTQTSTMPQYIYCSYICMQNMPAKLWRGSPNDAIGWHLNESVYAATVTVLRVRAVVPCPA